MIWMDWFDRLFPAAMIATPAVIALCSKRHERLSAEDAGPLMARLMWTTLGVLALFGAVQWALEATHEQRTGLRAGWSIVSAVLGFQFLWFQRAVPALGARDPGWRPPHDNPVRSASLRPRHLDAALPTSAWVVAWVVYAGLVAGVVWALFAGVEPMLALGLVFFPGFAWGARSSAFEPATFDPGGSAELAEAYRELRTMKAKGFLWLGLLASAVFAGTMMLIVVEPRWASLAGALGGSFVGLLGGLFGLTASMIRARANRLLAELADEPRQPAA